jgi:hypothetical protein
VARFADRVSHVDRVDHAAIVVPRPDRRSLIRFSAPR